MSKVVSIQKNKPEVREETGPPKDTFHIHLQGLVQGVGFRPFIYMMAKEMGLTGWVSNSRDGIHIEFNSDHLTGEQFYRKLLSSAPSLSKITSHSIFKTKPKHFNSFVIIDSIRKGNATLMLTPDFSLCENCKRELYEPGNFRYQYPFITCTHCGPRYSIITSLPYDRPDTTMQHFQMCETCAEEYTNPENRRHFSQTNSCSDCGIHMAMYDSKRNRILSGNLPVINAVADELNKGKILAVKGIGGYLLLCDANNSGTITVLRERKHRPAKPFAVMFPDVNSVEEVAFLQNGELDGLKNTVAPIVLLEVKKEVNSKICFEKISPHLSRLGVMLPYTPVFELILNRLGRPVIATSANVSEAPVTFKDEDALESLFEVADFVVANDREIIVPQDDSVIQFSRICQQKIIIRRSRGLSPSYFNYDCRTNDTILATGALLKSSFTFVQNKNVYISQYLGNTGSFEAQQVYSKTVQHFFDLFHKKPTVILNDKHPHYFTNHFAKELADELLIPTIEVQHHQAHFAAVLAENSLLQGSLSFCTPEPVLGVIWDGTGFGDDQNIWGGEFFTYADNEMRRIAHFGYFPFILSDKMAREPRISALAACADIPGADELLIKRFTPVEWKLYRQMLMETSLKCSSAGRIFDAVSSLLNLSDKQSYEGEAAMLLQECASRYFNQNGWLMNECYSIENRNPFSVSTLMRQIVGDIKRDRSAGFIAAKFFYYLVQVIKSAAEKSGIRKIAFSGGVFLNSLLVDLLILHLGREFNLHFHKELSPNDENISFGQMVYYDQQINSKQPVEEKNDDKSYSGIIY